MRRIKPYKNAGRQETFQRGKNIPERANATTKTMRLNKLDESEHSIADPS